MAVTGFQAEILRRIARLRVEEGETYVAGGLALNHQLRPRVSADIDVFNSTTRRWRRRPSGTAGSWQRRGIR